VVIIEVPGVVNRMALCSLQGVFEVLRLGFKMTRVATLTGARVSNVGGSRSGADRLGVGVVTIGHGRSGARWYEHTAGDLLGGLGPGQAMGWTVQRGQTRLTHSLLFKYFSNLLPMLCIQKYKTQSSVCPKISQHRTLADNFKWNNCPFWLNFKIPPDYELKILETKPI
jgi:hypothetical protein